MAARTCIATLAKMMDLFASSAPFLCRMLCHLLCPAMPMAGVQAGHTADRVTGTTCGQNEIRPARQREPTDIAASPCRPLASLPRPGTSAHPSGRTSQNKYLVNYSAARHERSNVAQHSHDPRDFGQLETRSRTNRLYGCGTSHHTTSSGPGQWRSRQSSCCWSCAIRQHCRAADRYVKERTDVFDETVQNWLCSA